MFDIEQFYKYCESGEKVLDKDIVTYIKSFQTVIIWGAAGLGQAVGRKLEEWRIEHLIYWDQRYIEIGTINKREIEPPFAQEYNRETTLITYCIPNHVIMRNLLGELANNKYKNVIRGDIFYSGILCPYCNGSNPSAEACWMKGECRSVICERLQNIIRNRNVVSKSGERIDLTYNCFIINISCSFIS